MSCSFQAFRQKLYSRTPDLRINSFPKRDLNSINPEFNPHEAEWTPFQTHYFSENLVAPGIEPGSSGSVDRNPDP
jgi:hypothetical protein